MSASQGRCEPPSGRMRNGVSNMIDKGVDQVLHNAAVPRDNSNWGLPMTTWDERMRPRSKAEPRLDSVEACWRMRSLQKATRIRACGIYRTEAGLEVRAGYEPDDLLRSQHVIDLGPARAVASQWRRAVIDKGGFVEVDLDGAP